MVYRRKDAILKHVPKLNKEDLAGINRAFTPYLFYREHRDAGFRECWCTSCREHFAYAYTQRTMDDQHREFLAKHHNEWSVCPKCGRHVKMKETARAKSCKSLTQWKRIVLVKPVKDAVYLLALYAVKDYQSAATRGGYHLIEPEKSEAAVYYLAPGYAREFKIAYDYTYLGLRSGDYEEPKRITEPFTKTVSYNYAAPDKRGYDWIGFDRLEKTFLRYAPIRLFERAYETWWYSNSFGYGVGECPDVKFLAYCALYPSVERLLKLESGLSDFVCELVENKPMKRYIDWTSPTPKEMFGMDKAAFADFRANYRCDVDFKVYQILRKCCKAIPYSRAAQITERYGEGALRIAEAVKKERLNLTRTCNYLERHAKKKKGQKKAGYYEEQHTCTIWKDYLRFARELDYDLTRDDVIYPKRLREAHDRAAEAVTAKQDAKRFEAYKQRYEKLQRMYAYTDGKYEIVIPTGINDIVQEGKVLSHCVGGYASRHVEGKTTIVFLRKCAAPEERLVTVEVSDSDKRICQRYGYRDRQCTEAEKTFLDRWIEWGRAGSKRPKQKKEKTKKAVEAA